MPLFTPKGFHNIAQGCREAATLGIAGTNEIQP
jgi:hypothetical protein